MSLLDADSLDGLLSRVAAAHPGFTLGLLVEGFHSYLRCRLLLISILLCK